jgi:MFS transporter, ACS family, hexuronate transporter
MKPRVPARWVAMGVFTLSGVLNYLDRLTLAQLAPVLEKEFDLTHQDYGIVVALFAVVYAACSPLAGALVDRLGLNRGISLAVALWSLANMATGLAGGLRGLIACRSVLAAAESAGVPAAGKAAGTYLPVEERALGAAVSNIGLGIGAMLAPPLATWFWLQWGWRSAFFATGALGFFWIPLWLWTARRVPPQPETGSTEPPRPVAMLRQGAVWGLIAANFLAMAPYTLWSNWTTIYLVEETGITVEQAAWYAPFPPLAANLGGLLGGWLSLRLIRKKRSPVEARAAVCLIAAVASLATALVPLASSPLIGVAGVGFSFFWVAAFSVNLYSIPLDLFGARRAAFAVSLLTAAYGVAQGVFSPLFGALIDRHGFTPVCLLVAIMPLAGYTLLRLTGGRAQGAAA